MFLILSSLAIIFSILVILKVYFIRKNRFFLLDSNDSLQSTLAEIDPQEEAELQDMKDLSKKDRTTYTPDERNRISAFFHKHADRIFAEDHTTLRNIQKKHK